MRLGLEKILAKAKQDLQNLFGEQMLSLLVYGSAAVDDYEPGQSDVNLLLVLPKVDLLVLDQLRKFTRRMRGQRVSTPLLLTPEQITNSADVFPIEFLEIKEKHRLLAGQNFFTHLKISTQNLRHECEHELRGRLLRLRQSFLEIGDRHPALRDLLLSAHNANFPAFRTILRLKKIKPPLSKEKVIATLVKTFALAEDVFIEIKRLRQGQLKLTLAGLRTLLEKYLLEVEKLVTAVDRF